MWLARNVLLLLSTCLVFACTSTVQAPVESPGREPAQKAEKPPLSVRQSRALAAKPDTYTVRRGDTLYSIAWNYGFDYRDVAAWNRIRSPYTIYPGQKLKLVPPRPAKKATEQLQQQPVTGTKKPQQEKSESPAVAASPPKKQKTPAAKPVTFTGLLRWDWPTRGKVIQVDTPISKNGIDISGREGQQIMAAAPGEVVYSGSGLLGYGRLIIIKHDETFLSAYAHNRELLVKEGDRVSAGQKIALMGRTNNGRTILHFEIRKNGQPVDPLVYLPKS